MDSLSVTRDTSSKQAIPLNEQRLATPLFFAIVMHCILILLIGWFWQQDTKQRMAEIKMPITHTAIKSYLISSQQYQSMLNESHSDTISQPQSPNQQTQPKPDGHNPKSPNKSNNEAVQMAPILATNTTHSPKPNKASTPPTPKVPTHATNTAMSIKQATSQYLQQQNQLEFEQLVGLQTAAQHKPSGTMSEMDAELDFIELTPTPTDTNQPHTLNHKLDPNRIVKQGDYCYTVVNLATQVNPHGWGLGFAQYCGEDKQKQQLTEAINSRVNNIKKTD